MSASTSWTIAGSEGLPVHGNTHTPEGVPEAHVLVIHGWTGCKDRNIVPAITHELSDSCVVHRCTLGHAGVERDDDRITRMGEFERDSLAHCVEDVRRVIEHLAPTLGRPFLLVGHSRGGATVLRCAAEAVSRGWARVPDGVVSLAGTATYTRFTEAMRDELERNGHVTRRCARAPGGVVRQGRSWYEHHLDHHSGDLFAEDMARVTVRVLIVHGDADDAVPPDHAETTCRLLEAGVCPSVEVVRVPDADHNFNAGGTGFDRPNISTPQTETCVGAIRRFLSRL